MTTPGLNQKWYHDCVKPPPPEGNGEYRFICPECNAVWVLMTGNWSSTLESYGFLGLRKRYVKHVEPNHWFCSHRPEVWVTLEVAPPARIVIRSDLLDTKP